MFSGIVEGVGLVRSAAARAGGLRLRIDGGKLCRELGAGESVSVSGVCLTAVGRARGGSFEVDVMRETLRRTSLGRLAKGGRVNLELPVRAQGRLGGHIVQGHVDGMGTVLRSVREGNGRRIRIAAPESLMRYVVYKGSVAVDGVSLTVASASSRHFEVALIPYTLKLTTLGELVKGSRVNLEADLLAKYLERLLKLRRIGKSGRLRRRPGR